MDDHTTRAEPPGRLAEVLRADQRERWLRGERAPVEEYLARRPELPADAALDLIYGEFVLREELGERPDAEDYLHRFPQYTDQLTRLFTLDRALLQPSQPDTAEHTQPQTAPPLALLRSEEHPRSVGKYVIVAPLGRGGQAMVFRAVHPALGKEVVLKLSREPLPTRSGSGDSLQAEGRILAELDHPNLARVYDLDVHLGRAFLVMEYLRGRNLHQYATEEKPSPIRAAELTAQAARGLAYAHRKGLLHLDVKPQNIVMDEAGRSRLIDFGLARPRHAWTEEKTESGGVTGTAAYMAPEQARGEIDRLGRRTDIFGLGGVLYFLLTGSPPYRGASWYEALEAARKGAWDRERLTASKAPRRLRAVCERALAANPDDRYADADDLAAELEAFVRSADRAPTRRAVLAAAVGLAGAAAVAMGVWHFFPRPGASPPPSAGGTPVAEAASFPALKISIWRKDRFRPLVDVVPLKTGDELRAEVDVPSGIHAALFLCTSEGVLKLLRQEAPSDGRRTLRYPVGEGETTTLTGPPGTEFVLACGRRSGPIGLDDLRSLWGDEAAWPALPGDVVLRLDREQVVEVQGGRDFGPTRSHVDPKAEVTRRLEALRGRLHDSFDFLSGVAFAHQAGE